MKSPIVDVSHSDSIRADCLVGKCPTVHAFIAGFKLNCLVDTGSTVTTVTESFFNTHLKTCTKLHTDITFSLKAANGISIPYVGYIEVDVDVMGKTLSNIGVLIVKDLLDPYTRQRKENRPGILGMNVISRCRELLQRDFGNQYLEEVTEIAGDFKMKELFKACDRNEHRDIIGFIKRCASSPVRIPANSVTTVNGTGPNLPRLYDAVVEPLKASGHLPGTFIVVHTFVTVRNGRLTFRVANIGDDDVWLAPKTRLGVLLKGDLENSDTGSVEFVRNGYTDEIYIHEDFNSVDTVINSSAIDDFEMPVDISHLSVSENQKDQIRTLFCKYNDVFSKDDSDVGYTTTVKHRIRTAEDVPISQPYRRIPPTQYEEVKNHIRKLVENKIVRESTSPYASPIVLVRKKDNSLRMCVDFRKLNNITHRDAYPLPRVEESFEALSGAKLFSTMDLTSGYNVVAMHEDDIEKTAFTTPFGLYEYLRMPFGLCNAPATFQRLMQHCFRDEIFNIL